MEDNSNMLEQITKQFSLGEQDVKTYSPLVLAYVGDCIYEIVIRTILVKRRNCQVQKLHKEATWFVKAATQAALMDFLEPRLTEEEQDVFRRGRNAKSHTVPKNANVGDYHKATGFEAVIGYLYLNNQMSRIMDLLYIALKEIDQEGLIE